MTKIIGDVCANHLHDRQIIKAMITNAAEVGVDIIKFQSFKADKLRKDYPNYEREYAYYKSMELNLADHKYIIEACREAKIEPLFTVYDLETVDVLLQLGMEKVKIPSPEATNWELIQKCFESFGTIFLSTGMHSEVELKQLRNFIKTQEAVDKVVLFYCVSDYPAQINLNELNKLQKIQRKVNGLCGFSDHTLDLYACIAAIALGVDYIERHYTLSYYLPGKDQHISSLPQDFAILTAWRNRVAEMDKTSVANVDYTEQRGKYSGRFWGNSK